MGPPTEDVFMGPVISEIHLEKVRSFVVNARKEGARIHCGETVDNLNLADAYTKVGISIFQPLILL